MTFDMDFIMDGAMAKQDEFEIPKCDKCGAEVTTGFMVFFCPQMEQCEFFEADWDDEMKDFVRAHWKATPA